MRTPYWTKKGHLGMTRAEVKAALAAGATLPAMTGDDAGKVLVIDSEGKLTVQEVFYFPISFDGVNTSTDITPGNLTAAVLAGKKIILTFPDLDLLIVSPVLAFNENYDFYTIMDFGVTFDNVNLTWISFRYSSIDFQFSIHLNTIPFDI